MNRKLSRSFYRAILGLRVGFIETNFKRHLVSSVITLAISVYYRLPRLEFAVIVLCIFLVLSAELFNTSIERLAKRRDEPREALDVASAAVLTISLGSLAVGLIILVPRCLHDPWILIAGIVIIPILWYLMEGNG